MLPGRGNRCAWPAAAHASLEDLVTVPLEHRGPGAPGAVGRAPLGGCDVGLW